MALPNFFIVGAAKAETSSLDTYLSTFPRETARKFSAELRNLNLPKPDPPTEAIEVTREIYRKDNLREQESFGRIYRVGCAHTNHNRL